MDRRWITLLVLVIFAVVLGVVGTVMGSAQTGTLLYAILLVGAITALCWGIMAGTSHAPGEDAVATRQEADVNAQSHGLPSTEPSERAPSERTP